MTEITLNDIYFAILSNGDTLKKLLYFVGIAVILFVIDHLIKKGDLL